MAETTANAVANYFIRFCHEHGDYITNLKLQKLVYYAQAWFLAIEDRPLFNERIEAWVHGPVQPDVYYRFRHHQWNPITDDVGDAPVAPRVKAHLDEVMEEYGGFTAHELERMTHAEAPWRKARGDLAEDQPSNAVISPDDMKAFYRERLGEQEEDQAS